MPTETPLTPGELADSDSFFHVPKTVLETVGGSMHGLWQNVKSARTEDAWVGGESTGSAFCARGRCTRRSRTATRAPGDRARGARSDGYVIDLVRADGELVEIQTGGFSPLRRKLDALLDRHRMRIVHPGPGRAADRARRRARRGAVGAALAAARRALRRLRPPRVVPVAAGAPEPDDRGACCAARTTSARRPARSRSAPLAARPGRAAPDRGARGASSSPARPTPPR